MQDNIGAFYKDKKILLIGGTGTVGQSLLKRLLHFKPKTVRIFSRDEYKQFQLAREYENNNNLRYLIGDVRDYSRLERAAEGIDYIFNLAAMKHVPACEYNPFEAVKTNVLGTQNVIDTAINCGVSHVLLTSSDKAINSTNAMGATKLLGERLMNAAQKYKGEANTVFSVVRFGNVMGSRGSVIPLFKKQALSSGVITVTDPDMTRFMMSISDAVDLTLEAMCRSHGGEIFVLKMPVIRIGDLVDVTLEKLQELYKLDLKHIKTKTIGLRPGEKRYEELMTLTESALSIELSKMYVILNEYIIDKGYYNKYPMAKANNYTSEGSTTISKDAIRALFEKDALIV